MMGICCIAIKSGGFIPAGKRRIFLNNLSPVLTPSPFSGTGLTSAKGAPRGGREQY
jgi:hypothetical protein